VSGTLGDAGLAVDSWLGGREPAAAVRARWSAPTPRVALARALAGAGAHAAIDLSDGLLADLGHLCRASGVGALVERERLPRSAEVQARDAAGGDFALSGGEDYEVLFACPPALESSLPRLAHETGERLTVIGRVTAKGGVVVVAADGSPHPGPATGYDHFAGGREPGR
jgi:thiamine-monophosphate kinase